MNFRRLLDWIFLNEYEWKKKYCPTLHRYLFKLNDAERREVFAQAAAYRMSHRQVCGECHGIWFDHEFDKCPECNYGKACGGYEINLSSLQTR